MGISRKKEDMSKNVQIIQPILTAYRKKLFDELGAELKYKLIISYSDTSPFGKSIPNSNSNKNIKYTKCGKWINFFDIFFGKQKLKLINR